MLGNIIGVEENVILLNLTIDVSNYQYIINNYVVIEDDARVVGEIIDIMDNIAYINLSGEIINNNFRSGVMVKPSFKSIVKIISKEKIPMVLGVNKYDESKHLYLGTNPIYDGVRIDIDINKFFSNHFAVFGSTGSGKSCSVARIVQNIYNKKEAIAYKSNLVIFDAYGEYHNAFKAIHENNQYINFKSYTTNLKFADTDILKLPFWLLGVDDIALLLNADNHNQLPIIETALKLVTVFARDENIVMKHKNDIIARALLDIFTSGRGASQIRDHITSVLSVFNTSELNLETPVYQPGYTRPFKQCLLIDGTGKIRDMELVIGFLEKFLDDTLELNLPDGTYAYTLRDYCDAMDFALISEGILKSDKVFDDCNVLKTRLHKLVNSDDAKYFEYTEFVTRETYLKKILTLI